MAKAKHTETHSAETVAAETVAAETVAAETVAAETVAAETATNNLPATVETQEPAVESAAEPAATEGIRARRAFMPKLFLPSKDWINKEVVARGQGTRATIGRVYGQCYEAQIKKQTLPDGKPSESIVLIGAFEAQNYISGELMSVSNAYLPMAYAERIKGVLNDETIKVVEIDCDIGLEATGKTIPYEWVVTAFLEGKEMERLRKMRVSRPRPAQLLLTTEK